MKNQHEPQKISLVYPDGDWRFRVNPRYIVNDPTMSVEEKRALLASWASDARAIPNYPSLRRLDNGRILAIDDVLEALEELDRVRSSTATPSTSSGRGHWTKLSRLWRRGRDDDDDDPSSPAPAGIMPPSPTLLGELAAAADSQLDYAALHSFRIRRWQGEREYADASRSVRFCRRLILRQTGAAVV